MQSDILIVFATLLSVLVLLAMVGLNMSCAVVWGFGARVLTSTDLEKDNMFMQPRCQQKLCNQKNTKFTNFFSLCFHMESPMC